MKLFLLRRAIYLNIAFVILSIGMFFMLFHDAQVGDKLSVNVDYFYWFSPKFAIIQTINHMLLLFGLLSCLIGGILTQSEKSFIFNIWIIFKSTFLNLSISILTTLICELIVGVKTEYHNFNVFFHSTVMFICAFVFMIFWALIGFGLQLTFKSRVSGIIVGVTYNMYEYLHLNQFYPEISKYLPLALSRELVVRQFPYWLPDSWIGNQGKVVFFANGTFIRDESVTYSWIFLFLFATVLMVYATTLIKFVKKLLQNRRGNLYAKRNIIS